MKVKYLKCKTIEVERIMDSGCYLPSIHHANSHGHYFNFEDLGFADTTCEIYEILQSVNPKNGNLIISIFFYEPAEFIEMFNGHFFKIVIKREVSEETITYRSQFSDIKDIYDDNNIQNEINNGSDIEIYINGKLFDKYVKGIKLAVLETTQT